MDCFCSPKIFPGHKGGRLIHSERLAKAGGTSNCSVYLGGVIGGGGGGAEEGSHSGSGSESSKGARSGILIFLWVQEESGKSSKSLFDVGASFGGC